ncbi:iron-sulfur cluster repair di-iron protein [Paenibacillus sp. 1P07SE]|uniref:iron-sulfur cluster repair di-iron protein n=1 Tax=Paenibacillus sp. 1P07SE TaxID=3132209 RepID=UPI0039A6A2EF
MTVYFTGEEKVGAIVTEFPGASNLFKEVRIDFCCGGDISLREAAARKKLDEPVLLQRLNDSYERAKLRAEPGKTDWKKASISQLIDHIVQRHHKYLQAELPLLSEFVTKVFRVHGVHQPELAQVHKRFHEMKLELDQHLIQEEELLFPLLLAYGEDPTADRRYRAVLRIRELEADHQGVGDILKELRELTRDYTLPQGACKTYTLTYHKLAELESDLFEHIHLENNILFARLAPAQAS